MARRRFTIIDGMVLIAAMAAGLGLTRLTQVPDFAVGRLQTLSQTRRFAHRMISLEPCALCFSTALVVLRFFEPRPPRRRLFRRWGTVACLAAAISPLTAAWPALLIAQRAGVPPLGPVWEALVFTQVIQCGAAVAVAWLTLWLAGLRRARRDWIDTSGLALGVYWITTSLLLCALINAGLF